METEPASAPSSLVCAICQTPIAPGEERGECPDCHAPYHPDCWEENGGCAIYGCTQVPATEHRAALDIPASYWGQEHKPCPACGTQILAAAVRCRQCGTTFASARPVGADEHREHVAVQRRHPELRRVVVWLFIFSIVSCSAPFAAVAGSVWWARHREAIKTLPPIYRALTKIGVCVAVGQTALMVLLTVLFSVTRSR
jgi:predicted RNA-binding Zn-ribbon protein involved in translation (DUF1610 family)